VRPAGSRAAGDIRAGLMKLDRCISAKRSRSSDGSQSVWLTGFRIVGLQKQKCERLLTLPMNTYVQDNLLRQASIQALPLYINWLGDVDSNHDSPSQNYSGRRNGLRACFQPFPRFFSSRSRSSRRRILPTALFGRASKNSTIFGTL